MEKFFIKNSNQEIKLGQKIRIKIPVQTPYGETKSEIDVQVTEASLKQLIKDKIVEVKDEGEELLNIYMPFYKDISDKLNQPVLQTIDFMNHMSRVSLHAHNILLMQAMARIFNGNQKFNNITYIACPFNSSLEYGAIDLSDVRRYAKYSLFVTKEAACKATELLAPFSNLSSTAAFYSKIHGK